LSSVFLPGLWHADNVKKYGYDRILQPIVTSLQHLDTHDGVKMIVGGTEMAIRASVVFVSADTTEN